MTRKHLSVDLSELLTRKTLPTAETDCYSAFEIIATLRRKQYSDVAPRLKRRFT